MAFLPLSTPLAEIKGTARFLPKLEKLGIITIHDLLWYFPTRYDDFSTIAKIADLQAGESATVRGVITGVSVHKTWRRRMFVVEATIRDDTGSIRVSWFNQRFLLAQLKKGRMVSIAGKVTAAVRGGLTFSHPVYEFVKDYGREETTDYRLQTTAGKEGPAVDRRLSTVDEYTHTGRLTPIYPETKGFTSKAIRFLVKLVFARIAPLQEFLPASLLRAHAYPPLHEAVRMTHFPRTREEATRAQMRFVFEKLFLLQLGTMRQRLALKRERAYACAIDIPRIKEYLARLPFPLTTAQKRTLWEILQDLAKGHPMNRLLQGDVGSGKTVVAALASRVVAERGAQSVFMAPTEVLARQHYETFKKFFNDFEQGVGLLTSADARMFYGEGLESTVPKEELLQALVRGKLSIVIGTHSVIQRGVRFKNVALVVVDEQHRFGVTQRRRLAQMNTQMHADAGLQTDVDTNREFLYQDLSYKVRGVIFKVFNTIGSGFKESVYQNALEEEFRRENITFQKEKIINVIYEGKKVGIYKPDFVIDDKIILEIKALPFLGRVEERQLWNYLRGSDYRLALLVNFGVQQIDIRRVVYDRARTSSFDQRESASHLRGSAVLPHFLSMSATPIPRTLSLALFGDLDLSIIDELPKDRKAIVTKVVPPSQRDTAYKFIYKEIKAGRQCFVICPRIELSQESGIMNYGREGNEVKNVKDEYEKLSKTIFPDLRVGMLHGKMKSKEKEDVMKKFKTGSIDLLVATSLVEVGVDVPNATVMMIEGAELFGLAQLYQFRGRVGRGAHQSYCLLFTDSSSVSTRARLRSLITAKNGFELAEKDLALRGPGEFLGSSQTGLPDVAMKAMQNPELIRESRDAAKIVLQEDPTLQQSPLLLEKLGDFEREVHYE